MKKPFAVLCVWNDRWHPPQWNEVIVVGSMADAEEVAKTCRRLGAELASVMQERAARRLAER